MKQLAMSLVFIGTLASVAGAGYASFDSWAKLKGGKFEKATYFGASTIGITNVFHDPLYYQSNWFDFQTGLDARVSTTTWESLGDLDTYYGKEVVLGTPTFSIYFDNFVQSGTYSISFYLQASSSVTILANPFLSKLFGIGYDRNGDAYALGVTQPGSSLVSLQGFHESGTEILSETSFSDTQTVNVRGFMTVSQTPAGSRGIGIFVPLGPIIGIARVDRDVPGIAPVATANARISLQVTSYSYVPAAIPWPIKPGSSNTSSASRGIRTLFKDSTGSVLHDSSYAMPFDRESIDLPTLGSYTGSGTLTLESAGILRKIVAISVVSGAVQIGSEIELHGGDINGDNSVDLIDYFALSDYYGLTTDDATFYNVSADGLTGFDADLNLDDSVDLLDYMIISDNYNLSGD